MFIVSFGLGTGWEVRAMLLNKSGLASGIDLRSQTS
jgi:hypothetical protein